MEVVMRFSEMNYVRPGLDEIKNEAGKIMLAFENADTPEAAKQAFISWDKLMSHADTMMSLAYVRSSIDTNDEFYEKEVEYIDEISPELTELGRSFSELLVNSRFRPELEKEYGSLLFLNSEIFLKAFSNEIIPETQETNRLETEYQKLIASAQIDFDGEKRTISQLSPYKQSPDDDVRRAAWLAEASFYSENGSRLDEIFDKLVKLRDEKAKKLGYDNFVKLGYLQMNRNCYTPKDVERFREAVVRYIVPIADRLYKLQSERTGLPYPFTFADAALHFRDGNPKPCGTPEDILETGRRLYHSLSEESGRFIDAMLENELMDVLSKKGKAGGGYCTQLNDYKVPFIFANFNGTADDVEVITHEAGHAFAFWCARDIFPMDNQSPTLEACEIHSMTMEFFGWRMSDEFFGADSDKFRYDHLFSALTFIPYGTMVDHFQHLIYEKPDMEPDERHKVWAELTAVYMPWMKLDGSPFYGEGRGWQRQLHIYENPFYYIDYCLAQTAALGFWTIMQKDFDEAWTRYMKLVRKAGTQTFTELIETAGLKSPFNEDALREVAEAAEECLRSQFAGFASPHSDNNE